MVCRLIFGKVGVLYCHVSFLVVPHTTGCLIQRGGASRLLVLGVGWDTSLLLFLSNGSF